MNTGPFWCQLRSRHIPRLTAAKLELALDERSGKFFGDEADMKAIKSDARRLARPAKSDSH